MGNRPQEAPRNSKTPDGDRSRLNLRPGTSTQRTRLESSRRTGTSMWSLGVSSSLAEELSNRASSGLGVAAQCRSLMLYLSGLSTVLRAQPTTPRRVPESASSSDRCRSVNGPLSDRCVSCGVFDEREYSVRHERAVRTGAPLRFTSVTSTLPRPVLISTRGRCESRPRRRCGLVARVNYDLDSVTAQSLTYLARVRRAFGTSPALRRYLIGNSDHLGNTVAVDAP